MPQVKTFWTVNQMLSELKAADGQTTVIDNCKEAVGFLPIFETMKQAVEFNGSSSGLFLVKIVCKNGEIKDGL